ncbi:Gfo/Idh/MocA family protein [Ensifer adhaerens]|uniref:Gfo/Idh/MocA family protein n=1 Tax=Ensifer adhaerens TaxID=106592 RepID=UPI003CFC1A48
MIKLGFVGYGAQAQEILVPCCQTLLGAEIHAICDYDADRQGDAGRLLPPHRIFGDYRHMIETCELDALIVACYPNEHYQIANHAIERRLPVFVEKPPAPSSLHLRSLIEHAERRSCTTGVGMNFRYASVTQRLKSLASGPLHSITLRHFCNKPTVPLWNQNELLGSFLYAQSIHSIDFLIDLCGPVADVSVFGDCDGSIVVMTVILRFSSGATASLVTSNTSPHFVFDFDAICTGGRHITGKTLWEIGVTEVGKTYAGEETKRWSEHWAHSPLESGFTRTGYAGQLTEFLDAVREKRESAISFRSVLETYRCLDEIEAQAKSQDLIVVQKAS